MLTFNSNTKGSDYTKHNTNPRYKHFTQSHYTAGDIEQFLTKYNYNYKQASHNVNMINTDNIYHNSNIKYNKELYSNISHIDIINTFYYLFEKFKKGIYIRIRNNKLVLFLPFSNANYINEWSKHIAVDGNIYDFFRNIAKMEKYKFNKRNIKYDYRTMVCK